MHYTIRVHMTPFKKDSPKAPYFWYISKSEDGVGGGCMVGDGWSKTPEAAWQAALIRCKEITGGTQNN